MRDGGHMERGGRWGGNTDWQLQVAVGDDLPIVGRANPEDQTITTFLSPSSMSHAQECPDDEWVETPDALQGTAVFDATGDVTTMPSRTDFTMASRTPTLIRPSTPEGDGSLPPETAH